MKGRSRSARTFDVIDPIRKYYNRVRQGIQGEAIYPRGKQEATYPIAISLAGLLYLP
jgi:hypothetical protein